LSRHDHHTRYACRHSDAWAILARYGWMAQTFRLFSWLTRQQRVFLEITLD